MQLSGLTEYCVQRSDTKNNLRNTRDTSVNNKAYFMQSTRKASSTSITVEELRLGHWSIYRRGDNVTNTQICKEKKRKKCA
jgi:hypothetical protein